MGTRPDGRSLVGSSDDVTEDEATDRGPDQGEPISNGGEYGRGAGDPHDGRPGDSTDYPDQNRTDEIVGTGDESGDETRHATDRSGDGQGLPGGGV